MKTLNLLVCAEVPSLVSCAREPAAPLAGTAREEIPSSHPASPPLPVTFRATAVSFGRGLLQAEGALSPLDLGA